MTFGINLTARGAVFYILGWGPWKEYEKLVTSLLLKRIIVVLRGWPCPDVGRKGKHLQLSLLPDRLCTVTLKSIGKGKFNRHN